MAIFVAIVVVVALLALVVAALMRSGGDDTSVRSYHTAIGTLEHLQAPERRLRGRPAEGAPRETGGPPPDATFDPIRASVPPVPVRGNEEFPDPEEPLVFDDARPRDRYVSSARGGSSAQGRTSRAQRYALDSMNRRPRRVGGVVIVVLVIAAFAGLAYAGSRHSKPPRHASSVSSHSSTTTPTTVVAHHHSSTTKPTTTTVPPTQIVALTSSSNGATATYPVANNSFSLSIAATGPCWVNVTTVASGSTLWTGTLQAGQSQTVQATGSTSVELGATGVTMTLDHTPVVLPSNLHTPFTATFQPTTPTTATSTP